MKTKERLPKVIKTAVPVEHDPFDAINIGFLCGLIACGKTNREISDLLKIDEKSVRNYRKKYASGELDQLLTERTSRIKSKLPGLFLESINQLIGLLLEPERLSKLSADRLAVTLGILVDKYRLMTNQSTSNVHSIISRVQSLVDPRTMIDE